LGERLLCKQEVIGSNPFTSTTGATGTGATGRGATGRDASRRPPARYPAAFGVAGRNPGRAAAVFGEDLRDAARMNRAGC
jgi:hypothetical protein